MDSLPLDLEGALHSAADGARLMGLGPMVIV